MDKSSDAKDSPGTSKRANGDKPQTSASAFASSGFAKLASSSTSPFGALGGGSGKPSLFGASSGPSGSFSVLGGQKPTSSLPSAPKLTFGGGASSNPSPFSLSASKTSVFGGSPFASAFGGKSALAGPRLSTFGKPGEALKSDKPAKPFGAPESDNEDGSEKDDEDDESKAGEAASDKEEGKETDKDDLKTLSDEKKKIRLQRGKFKALSSFYRVLLG